MPMYNLIKYSDNYSNTSGSLWKYYRDEPNYILGNSESFKYKMKIIWKATDDDNTKERNFWRTLEMLLINCEISLIFS